MAFSFILRLIHAIGVILAPVLIFNYDIEYVGSKFNRNDKTNAYCMFHLAPNVLMSLLFTSPDSLFLSKIDVEAVLRIFVGLGSIKLIERYGTDKAISVTRFFLGFTLASTALLLSLPSLENNTPIKFVIGLMFTQITTLTPIAVVMIIILNSYSYIFYSAIVKLTQFNFFNFDICFTILVIFIGTCVIPRIPEEEFN
ncbi:hypothetical protein CONCODRAFT_78900 [Conidiobolus coronatus NRRL 28638]|uniref:Uncharacterized protein n=1 Tax=Conidiobolus coronatus (strain ATCC 28846 / CBS 209.66 / NRRL 28638) TaxID=796925 RepID=A0A137P5R4_CONC2|nr:hypothetical protein CONCODRAFT_78900 [Conidiobolus coronatus NRRL 28638]|eukprot:KXN70352.1 hypothetical protein CONCODRAFT_78900 [Conidiobolus coronatus NRRL 28638]